ncbi:MAG TPA: hypothetical protein DEG17_24240 [Cyanobacteria bacterium UBA11149]|nr:hypothetical protein [Cyanobacteria bacterium UBA11367]HBE56932.1 hypothetical protein [Cyanobacteria bacterium UBA11366]HBK63572.1 hypothetical protein [Cyanobacteria bacterium UBA11166]HBR73441.1 hypothetical protein [Cyanobacteria bacterium UBA11159]HBS68714.1 hypothetical protein [Cyanobacteria bacterium UBA11153]HBW91890.1 hypothetical protein [Cyanobacteria bacterium UBA11149]HCA94539.1 hypothetical protein [Cyanobacteria bacterium UBA9226]
MEILASEVLGTNKFDQCAINMALINICDRESDIGQEMLALYRDWKAETDEAVSNPWLDLHQFTIYVPHPDREYEGITMGEGLTKGYNIEVQRVKDPSHIPYKIPEGGHFIVVLKQRRLDAPFQIAATGILIRPLAAIALDIIIDPDKGEYQSLIIKHPIIRNYPEGWEEKFTAFIKGEITSYDLPNVVGYVDSAFNRDYRSPSWDEMYLAANGLGGF